MSSLTHSLAGPCCIVLACAAPPAAQAAQITPRQQEQKGTYLGVLFSPRPAGQDGVVVTHVLPGSPAERAELRRNDVLLRYDGHAVRDTEHLANLIRADRPDRKVKLLLQRGDATRTVEVTLALGPALKLAPDRRDAAAAAEAKPAGVTVSAAPLESGKLRLTIEYTGTAGKREVVSCEGGELSAALERLPQRERSLVRVALERLRMLNLEPTPARR